MISFVIEVSNDGFEQETTESINSHNCCIVTFYTIDSYVKGVWRI